MRPARLGVERQLLAVERDGFHAATKAVGHGQVASEAGGRGGVLADVAAEVDRWMEDITLIINI